VIERPKVKTSDKAEDWYRRLNSQVRLEKVTGSILKPKLDCPNSSRAGQPSPSLETQCKRKAYLDAPLAKSDQPAAARIWDWAPTR
jgi:hypothetical protein